MDLGVVLAEQSVLPTIVVKVV